MPRYTIEGESPAKIARLRAVLDGNCFDYTPSFPADSPTDPGPHIDGIQTSNAAVAALALAFLAADEG